MCPKQKYSILTCVLNVLLINDNVTGEYVKSTRYIRLGEVIVLLDILFVISKLQLKIRINVF